MCSTLQGLWSWRDPQAPPPVLRRALVLAYEAEDLGRRCMSCHVGHWFANRLKMRGSPACAKHQ